MKELLNNKILKREVQIEWLLQATYIILFLMHNICFQSEYECEVVTTHEKKTTTDREACIERESKGALVLPGAPYSKSEGSVIKRQKGKRKS